MASKRELIDTGTDKRFVRRDKGGQFKEFRRCRPLARRGREEEGEDDGEIRPGRQRRSETEEPE